MGMGMGRGRGGGRCGFTGGQGVQAPMWRMNRRMKMGMAPARAGLKSKMKMVLISRQVSATTAMACMRAQAGGRNRKEERVTVAPTAIRMKTNRPPVRALVTPDQQAPCSRGQWLQRVPLYGPEHLLAQEVAILGCNQDRINRVGPPPGARVTRREPYDG